jgi:hypothetical protein
MKDRIPRYAGRIKLIPVDENNGIYYMERADEPIQEGTPLNKNTLLKDETAEKVGLDNEATVDLVLNALADKQLSTESALELINTILQELPISRGGTGANTLKSAKDNFGISYIEEILKKYVYFGTRGLVYELNGNTYVCTSIGTATDENIIISPKVDGVDVTSIGEDAFEFCRNITSIEIPDSVTSIGNDAFYNCTSLNDVYYDGDVEGWLDISFDGDFAQPMYYAKNLYFNNNLVTNIVIPNSATSIGDRVFYHCDSLTSIEIPDSVTSIGYNAFKYCTSLTSIDIPDSVTSIGNYAFEYCTSLTSVAIGDSVTSIPDGLFNECTSLSSVDIGNSVRIISINAFRNCTSLTSITLPNTITSIGWAFRGCTSLTDIYVPWAEGAVSGAPWGADKATIHYNSEV